MKKLTIALVLGGFAPLFFVSPAQAEGRYSIPPVTTLSSDLASPWLLQLGKKPLPRIGVAKKAAPMTDYERRKLEILQARLQTEPKRKKPEDDFADRLKPQMVSYETKHEPGTVIISTAERYLYLVLGNGKARRYGVGVGKEGFTWSGTNKISRKAEWPGWTPPKEMIERERKKGKELPAYMPGGPDNPLGARALYLGNTLYRIHGTTQPWSIGKAVSSGCIRMRNQDVIDFYDRVKVGTKVVVLKG